MNIQYKENKIGRIKLIGYNTEELQMWSINHYIDSVCNNYNKILIIRRICELMQEGASDNQFIVAKRSIELFPAKPIEETYILDLNKYIVLSSKGKDPDKFWHIIKSYVRPMVFYKEGNKSIPLIDFQTDDAIKVTSMSYNSPVEINLQGVTGAILDIINEPNRRQMEEERHINDLINGSINNVNDIARASQTINDPRTPDGVKEYANAALNELLIMQDKLNKKLGMRTVQIDIRG